MTERPRRRDERGRTRKTRLSHGAILAILVALPTLGAPACKSDAAPDVPSVACGLAIWHKPATTDAHVEIVGDWNNWQRPGFLPTLRSDGWVNVNVDTSPGEHLYAIVEDGVWLTDAQQPMSAFYNGQEVALATAQDCSMPQLQVGNAAGSADGSATVSASFLAASGGKAIDPSSVTATSLDGATSLTVASVDASTGVVQLTGSALARGKYQFSIGARDADGKPASAAIATLWIEPRAWDPRDSIIYQVVLDRYRGPSGPLATPTTPAERAGGTLNGLRDSILAGDLDALGINTLWLSPLYKNPDGDFPGNDGREYSSYHGYWPSGSKEIDSRFASDDDLDAFMKLAHDRGIRVLFDVVPNHVHQEHPFASQHPDWFNSDSTCICGVGSCDWATHIETCWFASYLPDLDWTNITAARAATDEVMWWFDRWGADGLRVDAVPMMQRAATRRIAHTIRTKYEHPGNVPYILGENFTGPGAYQDIRYDLGPFGLDGAFNFPIMWQLRSSVGTETDPMANIDTSFKDGQQAWNGSGAIMGMIIGNHDVSRFASVSAGSDGGDTWTPAPQPVDPQVYGKQQVALATILTLPGAPVVYYGDEVGLAGKSDPDSRRVMPAESDLLPVQVATRDVVRKIGRARACSDALRRGDLDTIEADDERYVFARQNAGDLQGMAIVALARRPTTSVTVPLPAGAPTAWVDVVTGAAVTAQSGALAVDDTAFGVHVFVAADGPCAKP